MDSKTTTMKDRVNNFLNYYSDMFSFEKSTGQVTYKTTNTTINTNMPSSYLGAKTIIKKLYFGAKNYKKIPESYTLELTTEDYELIADELSCYQFQAPPTTIVSNNGNGGWRTVPPSKNWKASNGNGSSGNTNKEPPIGYNHDAVLSGIHICVLLAENGLRIIKPNEVAVGHPDLRVKVFHNYNDEHGMIGAIDLLCLDKNDNLVIVDLKTVNKSYKGYTLSQLVLKEDHSIQLELYAHMFEYMARKMQKDINNTEQHHLKIAYSVILGYDTTSGKVGLWKVKRNPSKWLLSKGLESRRMPIMITTILPPSPSVSSPSPSPKQQDKTSIVVDQLCNLLSEPTYPILVTSPPPSPPKLPSPHNEEEDDEMTKELEETYSLVDEIDRYMKNLKFDHTGE